MKTNVSIKFNSVEEYREIENKLIELGYKSDEDWNESILSDHNIQEGYVFIHKGKFSIFSHKGAMEKLYNSLQEFLNDK